MIGKFGVETILIYIAVLLKKRVVSLHLLLGSDQRSSSFQPRVAVQSPLPLPEDILPLTKPRRLDCLPCVFGPPLGTLLGRGVPQR